MPNNTLSTAGLFVAPDGPPYLEVTRSGGHWTVISATDAPETAIPTTNATLEVWNNIASGMTMVVTDLFCWHKLGTAVLHSVGLWAMVTAAKAAPTLSALTVSSQSGRPSYTTTAGTRVVTAQVVTTLVANGWRPWGTPGSGIVSTALPGEAFSVPVDGKLIVPPGCSLAVVTTDAVATAASVRVGASWVEYTPALSTPA